MTVMTWVDTTTTVQQPQYLAGIMMMGIELLSRQYTQYPIFFGDRLLVAVDFSIIVNLILLLLVEKS